MSTPYAKLDPAVFRQLITSVNDFSFRLLREVAEREGSRSFFLSPFSVFSALALLYNGAAGDTRRAMAETLEWPGKAEALNEAFAALRDGLLRPSGEDGDYRLELANSLWANQDIGLSPEFIEKAQTYFHAETKAADFRSPATVDEINQWVAEQTHGKIPSILDRTDPLTLLLLLNAVYFKGAWKYPFDPALTEEGDFHLSGGHTKRLPMMHMKAAEKLSHYQSAELEAVRLPYGKDRISMYILLPDEKTGLDAFLHRLRGDRWQKIERQLRPEKGRVILPRFKLDYAVPLNDPLAGLGMSPAFHPATADFSGLSDARKAVHLSEVRHKTFLEVNEEGSEAAAVTGVVAVFASMTPPPRPFTMVVDRPFFCAIKEEETGVLLFVGGIYEPE